MGADEDVDPPELEVTHDLSLLLWTDAAREQLDADRILGDTVPKRAVMLGGEHRRGHEECHLLGVDDGFHRGPNRHLRLAEPHVAAEQSVHRALPTHVSDHLFDGALLIGRLLKGEGGLEGAVVVVGF